MLPVGDIDAVPKFFFRFYSVRTKSLYFHFDIFFSAVWTTCCLSSQAMDKLRTNSTDDYPNLMLIQSLVLNLTTTEISQMFEIKRFSWSNCATEAGKFYRDVVEEKLHRDNRLWRKKRREMHRTIHLCQCNTKDHCQQNAI